jgi:hypothetical protein
VRWGGCIARDSAECPIATKGWAAGSEGEDGREMRGRRWSVGTKRCDGGHGDTGEGDRGNEGDGDRGERRRPRVGRWAVHVLVVSACSVGGMPIDQGHADSHVYGDAHA